MHALPSGRRLRGRKGRRRSTRHTVRLDAPSFAIPSYDGERYESRVPDTLDLADMASLAINGLTCPNDPANGYELYFVVDWFRNPPAMYHEFSSAVQTKFLGPLVLNRIISGSDLNLPIEKRMIEFYLRGIDAEGLYHTPQRGRPWHVHGWEGTPWGGGEKWTEQAARRHNQDEPPYGGARIDGRLIEAILLYYLRDGNPLWKAIVEKMIENGTARMVDRGDWGYFGSPDQPPSGFEALDGWTAQGLAQAYRVLGTPRAKEAAGKCIRFLRDHSGGFDAEGRFLGDVRFFGDYKGQEGGHFHGHTNCLLAFVEYGLAVQDAELLDYARRSYKWDTL